MAEVNIAYNKNDFLFNLYNNDNCNGDSISLNCKNKTEGEKLIKAKNNYNASDERYNNLMDKYHNKFIDTFNLSAGIILGLGFIFYNYK
tara:strand:- start:9357 stop:9623 length:267 start_codon:yes stop_codon:yes gene_type:complete